MKRKRQHITATVDKDLLARFKDILQKENRSLSNGVEIAIRDYVEDKEMMEGAPTMAERVKMVMDKPSELWTESETHFVNLYHDIIKEDEN